MLIPPVRLLVDAGAPLEQVALVVADAVGKIRVNPGNFADGRKTFEELVYETDEQYYEERSDREQ